MNAERVRRQAINELLSLDISPRIAQHIWLCVSGVLSATSQLPCIPWAWSVPDQAASQRISHHASCAFPSQFGLYGLLNARPVPPLQKVEVSTTGMLMYRRPCGQSL